MTAWEARGRTIVAADDPVPKIMGVLNVTPDSFSDGGKWADAEAAAARALELVREGADILDVGGESSRPGAEPVSLDEELRRVLPVVEAIAGATDRAISVDTVKPEVARRALVAGAAIVNDIRGFRDPAMLRVAREFDAGVVVMHMAGEPATMQANPHYDDVVTEVYDWLALQVETLVHAGLRREQIAVDPGIGFGKTIEHNLDLLRNLRRFASLGCTLLIGTSRKRFLGTLTGRPVDERAVASVVSSLAAAAQGARVLRVHDVGPMSDAVKVWSAVRGWEQDKRL